MDDCDDCSDYDDYDSGGDVFDEEDDDFDDGSYSGGEDLEEDQELEDEEEDEEGQEEEEEAEDEMEDYEEEISENGEQHDDDEEIVEYDGVVIEGEEEEDQVYYEEEEEGEEEELMEEEEEEEEEELFEEDEEEGDEDEVYGEEDELYGDEEEVYGDEEEVYEDETDSDDEIAAPEPPYVPRQTIPAPQLGELLDPRGDGRGLGSSGSHWRGNEPGNGTAPSRPTVNNVITTDKNVVGISGSNESTGAGLEGAICPICFESWTGEGQHCVCCLPCGHLYGLSCIKTWLQRSNSQKCPQCNDVCQLEDVRRLYGMQPAITGAEALKQKVKFLEEKCASLELKDADWVRKEAEWQKREADLEEQVKQHKQGGSVNHGNPGDTRERHDLGDDHEPTNAFNQMKL